MRIVYVASKFFLTLKEKQSYVGPFAQTSHATEEVQNFLYILQ
jgi:hypothetical protein